MLEDPSYASVVRWGDEMDSFVVLEVGMNPDQPCRIATDSVDRTNGSPSRSSPNTSNTATLPALFDS